MIFIRKHTEGPWREDIWFCDGDVFVTTSDDGHICHIVSNNITEDSRLISQAPAMLDYLIERAELLDEQTHFNDSAFDDGWKSKKQELYRLLEIIRAAGVEVEE